jgi:hypothetical protein
MTDFIARRAAPDVDIWNLFEGDVDIGCLTRFPGEGPMATVAYHEEKVTVSGETLHATLVKAKAAYLEIIYGWDDDEHIEDEDGEIAFMRMMERRNEPFPGTDWEPYEERDEP